MIQAARLGAAKRAPRAEDEYHLPAIGIEVPGAGGIGVEIPAEMPRHQPQHDGGQHRQVGLAQHHPQDRRKKSHQHDVERQHVQVDGLELEQQSLAQRFGCVIDEACDVELVDQLGIHEASREKTDRDDVDDEQDDVRDIELPDALGEAGGADDKAAIDHHPRVDEGGGIARDEHEQVGGVGKPVVPGRDPVDDVVGDVVQKDRPVRDPAKQVEPEITSFFGKGCVDFHGGRFEVMLSRKVKEPRLADRSARNCHSAASRLSQRSIMTIPVRKS